MRSLGVGPQVSSPVVRSRDDGVTSGGVGRQQGGRGVCQTGALPRGAAGQGLDQDRGEHEDSQVRGQEDNQDRGQDITE